MMIWIVTYVILQMKIQKKNKRAHQVVLIDKRHLDVQLRDFNQDNLKSRFYAHTKAEWHHLLQYQKKYAVSQQKHDLSQNIQQTLTHLICACMIAISAAYFFYYQLSTECIILCITCIVFCIDHTQWVTEQAIFIKNKWCECDDIIKNFAKTVPITPSDKIKILTKHTSQYIAITGPSGSGKTTLLQNYIDHLKITNSFFAQRIFVITQHDKVLHRTLYENLCMGVSDCSEHQAMKALKDACIDYITQRLANGLESNISPSNLSSGQQQQIMLARIFILKPHTIICDEASAAIDFTTTQKIITTIKLRLPKTKIIWVSHRPQELLYFRNKISMQEKRLQYTEL